MLHLDRKVVGAALVYRQSQVQISVTPLQLLLKESETDSSIAITDDFEQLVKLSSKLIACHFLSEPPILYNWKRRCVVYRLSNPGTSITTAVPLQGQKPLQPLLLAKDKMDYCRN